MLSEERLKELAAWTPGGKATFLSATRDDWQEMARDLLALRWKPITPESLPKVGDELFRPGEDYPNDFPGVAAECGEFARFSVYLKYGYTHYRPINPPAKEPEPNDQ